MIERRCQSINSAILALFSLWVVFHMSRRLSENGYDCWLAATGIMQLIISYYEMGHRKCIV